MKRLLCVLILVLSMSLWVGAGVANAFGLQGVFYNYNAGENEAAMRVVHGDRPDTVVKGGDFRLQRKEVTIAEVETRIQELVDSHISTLTLLNQIEADDPVRQNPPELGYGESIYIEGSREYLRAQEWYFAIHIYSLDDLATPQSELRFTTRFQYCTAGPIEGEVWW